jgi:hypothetical protein
MSMHLFAIHPHTSAPSRPSDELRLLSGYENGGVTLRSFIRKDKPMSVDGFGWEVIWTTKLHVESSMGILSISSGYTS